MFDSLLTGKIMGGISLVLLIILAAFGTYHYFLVGTLEHKITNQANTIATLTTANALLTGANEKLAASIDKQNLKIQETVKAQKDASDAAANKLAAVTLENSKISARFNALLNAPRTTDNDCQEITNKLQDFFILRHDDDPKKGTLQ